MAAIAASDVRPLPLCGSSAAVRPVDGVVVMYLLMSLVHLAPWLALASDKNRSHTGGEPS